MTDKTREDFEAWVTKQGYASGYGGDGVYDVWVVSRWWESWQAATQQSAARIAALEAEVAALTTALFECREAFPIPEPGSPLEPAWMGAMTDPEDVPEYVKAEVLALRKDARRYQAFFDAGLPITFLGVEYYTKPDLDAGIDAAIEAERGEG